VGVWLLTYSENYQVNDKSSGSDDLFEMWIREVRTSQNMLVGKPVGKRVSITTVDGRIILKCILKEWGMKVWTEFR
jgi:hypothetical protein